jgi:hypothetical protein
VSERGRPGGARKTLTPEAEAEEWATELESWSLVREKVPERLDITKAREARTLAKEIRALAAEIGDARKDGDHSTMSIFLETLGTLRQRALGMLRE